MISIPVIKAAVEFCGTSSGPSLRLLSEIGRFWRGSDGLETKSPQPFNDRLDQPFDLSVIGVADMLVSTLATNICSRVVELSPDRMDLETAKTLGQDRTFEPVVQVIR